MRRLTVLSLIVFLLLVPGQAFAHGLGQSTDLPIPLWLYLFGAAVVVLVSFVQISLFVGEGHTLRRYPRFDLLRLGPLRALLTSWPLLFSLRLLSVAIFLLVILSGLLGQQDTASNFAPTFVWIIWWVGFSFFTAFVGNIWPLVNPWKVLFEWADGLTRRLGVGKGLELHQPYPAALGVWPALVFYFVFVWTELIFGAAIPFTLAIFVLYYSILTWAGMVVFGKETWLRRGEAFSVFFDLLGRFAPSEVRVVDPEICKDCTNTCKNVDGECVDCYECFAQARPENRQLNVRPWAVGLALPEWVPPGGLFFVIFVLAGIAFDTLLATPQWGELEYLTSIPKTLGLIALPLFYLAVYIGFVKLSQRLSGSHIPLRKLATTYVYSLVSIAIAYQAAHYYTYLLIQGQAIIALVSDPFGWGWNLFGTADYKINAGLVDANFVWYSQVALIVLGHVIAVYLAHVAALRLLGSPSIALRSQYPMLVLMIFYTVFSLWLLSH
jgi:hypothetical protein